VIRGWAEYHHTVCEKETFSKIDHCIWETLWKWSKRRHPNTMNIYAEATNEKKQEAFSQLEGKIKIC